MDYKRVALVLVFVCLVELCSIKVEAATLSELFKQEDLESQVEKINDVRRGYAEKLRMAMIDANPGETDGYFLLNATHQQLAKGIAHYLEQKSNGKASARAATESGPDDFRSMFFSIAILDVCGDVVSNLEATLKDMTAPQSEPFVAKWLQTTRMCQKILADKDQVREQSLRALIRMTM